MNTHDNSSLTPRGREQMVRAVVDDGLSKMLIPQDFQLTQKGSIS